MFIDAIRNIKPGEELGYDYQLTWESTDDPVELALYACRCGAKTMPRHDAGPRAAATRRSKMMLPIIVVSVAENGVDRQRQPLPWHLPDDLKRFKALTLGKPIVMGRTHVRLDRPAAAGAHEHRRLAPGRARASKAARRGAVARRGVRRRRQRAGDHRHRRRGDLPAGAAAHRHDSSDARACAASPATSFSRSSMPREWREVDSGTPSRRMSVTPYAFSFVTLAENRSMSRATTVSKCPGYCCSHARIAVSDFDIARLARHFGFDRGQAKERFTYRYRTKDVGRADPAAPAGSHLQVGLPLLRHATSAAAPSTRRVPTCAGSYPYGKACGYYDFPEVRARASGRR